MVNLEHAQARACAKAILLGEHFVVHGSTCLAVPLQELFTQVTIAKGASAGLVLRTAVEGEGPRAAVERAASLLGVSVSDCEIDIESTIPLGCGLGSSASFAVAVARALSAAAGAELDAVQINDVAFQLEHLTHGTPSGVDNAVIAFERAVRFRRGQLPLALKRERELHLVVADSGERCSTAEAVGRVAAYRSAHPEVFQSLLADVEAIVNRGIEAYENGEAIALAAAMRENHALLREVGVSTPKLEELVRAAERAGASGAKLTGAGGGGCIVALARASARAPIAHALRAAGAVAVFSTLV